MIGIDSLMFSWGKQIALERDGLLQSTPIFNLFYDVKPSIYARKDPSKSSALWMCQKEVVGVVQSIVD